MNPNHTFYIDRHPGSISLDGAWSFCYHDTAESTPAALDFAYTASRPASGYRCLEQAGILPDDLVVVHRQTNAYNGEIVVAMIEDEATVKRLSRQGGRTWLLPENDDYSPIDGTYAQILGKVAAVVRRY